MRHIYLKKRHTTTALLALIMTFFVIMTSTPFASAASGATHTVTLSGDEHNTLTLNGADVDGNSATLTVADGKALAAAMAEQGYTLDTDTGYALEKLLVKTDAQIEKFAACDGHTAVLLSNGKVYTRGINLSGELGREEELHTYNIVSDFGEMSLPEGITVKDIYTAGMGYGGRGGYTVVTTTDGKAYSCGSNSSGLLGRPENNGSYTPNPTLKEMILPNGITVVSVAAGSSHLIIIGSDGNAYSCGSNINGELGRAENCGSVNSTCTLAKMNLPENITAVSAAVGSDNTIIIGSDNNAYSCGANLLGQLGRPENNGTYDATPTLGKMDLPDGISAVSASIGYAHSIIIGSDGKAYSCGYNQYGQLGRMETNGISIGTPILKAMNLPQNITAVAAAAGDYHSIVIGSDGKAYSCGDNYEGQLGRTENSGIRSSNPTLTVMTIPGGVTAVSALALDNSTVIIASNGKKYACGTNCYGQLCRPEIYLSSVNPSLGEMTLLKETAEASSFAAVTVTKDMDVTAVSKVAVQYSFLSGANGTYTLNSDGSYTIRANGEFEKFSNVTIDGNIVADTAFDAESGSTVITFHKDFMNTLTVGSHTIVVNFTDGTATTALTVKAAENPGKDPGKTPGESSNETTDKTPGTASPATGDNADLFLWSALLLLSGTAVVTLVTLKKKKSVQ